MEKEAKKKGREGAFYPGHQNSGAQGIRQGRRKEGRASARHSGTKTAVLNLSSWLRQKVAAAVLVAHEDTAGRAGEPQDHAQHHGPGLGHRPGAPRLLERLSGEWMEVYRRPGAVGDGPGSGW